MTILTQFDTPGRIDEFTGAGGASWHDRVNAELESFTGSFPQFYNPTVEDTPAGLTPATIVWPAFPARITRELGPGPQRWEKADSDREEQDEYCEWSVERAGAKISRVTFTTEVPEYWDHAASQDPDLLVRLYREHVDPAVELDDLLDDGRYNPRNQWNDSTTGRLAHLQQTSNNLHAAVALVAQSTVLRERADGTLVTDRQELVSCGLLGNPFRNSDPQIAEIVNDAAALGTQITLLDPVGLYLDGLLAAGMETPDGADASAFWNIERGVDGFAVRANLAVPPDRGYVVGDIRINGRPIETGAQVADKVRVRVQAIAKPGTVTPARRPCEK